MVAKTFPPKQVSTKILDQKFTGSKLFMAAKSFPQKHVPNNIFIKNVLAENLLLMQNH
jgi:hypothetical protein